MDPQQSKSSAEQVTVSNHPSGHLVDAGSSTSASVGKGNSSKTCVSALQMLHPANTHVNIFWTASGWTAFLYCNHSSIFDLKGIIQGRIVLLSLERVGKGWFGHGSYSCIPYCRAFSGSRTNRRHTLWIGKHGISLGNCSSYYCFILLRELQIAGEPLEQTVYQYGPFVMTSREEIQKTLIDCEFSLGLLLL